MGGASAAAHSGWAADRGPRGDSLMSIGEVLAHLRVDFPDTTISKLRFLETEGLVEPRRTPAGYRKYSGADVSRLRFVLTAQRDHYLPLRVIREHLAALDQAEPSSRSASQQPGQPASRPANQPGGPEAPGSAGLPRLRPSLTAVGTPTGAGAPPEAGAPDAGAEVGSVRLTREQLVGHAGIEPAMLTALEDQGLIAPRPGGWYDADALEIATAAARLAEYGLQARHLRAYRLAADREIGLFAQLVAPMARQAGPAARARAAEAVRELAGLTERIHAALVRAGLRETLGR